MRRTFFLFAAITAAWLAQPASAELKHYRVVVDDFSNTPGGSPSFDLESEILSGHAIVSDRGDGAPTLVDLRVSFPFNEFVADFQEFTMLPGAVVISRQGRTEIAAPHQMGAGSSSATIDWGTLTGWTTTGFLFCQESPAALLNVLCMYGGGVSGVTLTPVPSRASAYDAGVWTFTSDMSAFNGPKFLYETFVGGSFNTQWRLRGELVQIPAVPLLGASALGAALVYLGVRAVRRSSAEDD